MTKARELHALGQSIWYDNIRRELLDSGELQALLDSGVMGVTSNPTIFEKAIAGHHDYDEQMKTLVAEGESIDEIYEALVIADIMRAADLLAPIYEQTNGKDGYISLEVSPTLAHDTEGTIKDARRLFKTVGRPNVMIKIPATDAGIPAIETLIGDGININVTLIFALKSYEAVMSAYIAGLEKLASVGGDLSRVASVASFFISRVDSAVDAELDKIGTPAAKQLQGKIAIANAKMAYALFQKYFSGPRWEKLVKGGARVQRPLWASTGTKNPAYSDTLYIDSLIGPDTVNTVPPATLTAAQDHATVARTIDANVPQAQADLEHLAKLGVDLNAITKKVLDEGVASFSKSFESLMKSIADKRALFILHTFGASAHLGSYQAAVDSEIQAMDQAKIAQRLWKKDHTIWRDDPTEISNRLGWLDSPTVMAEGVDSINKLVEQVIEEGYKFVLLLGMGGSSLAPEVFQKTYGARAGFLELQVVDSTDGDFIAGLTSKYPPSKTLYIVSTKSGGTVETFSFFRHFYNQTLDTLGPNEVGKHFVAITDPGSNLAEVAAQYKFRATFINDPNIGGRYSALSYFGLVPAALVGVALSPLLEQALHAAWNCGPDVPTAGNVGLWLGAILGKLAKVGRDKVTFITSPVLRSFGDWAEQLIAESTGKDGKGILPVVGEFPTTPDKYGKDRLFVYLRHSVDQSLDGEVNELVKAGHPVVRFNVNHVNELAAQFLIWEVAVAIAGHIMKIQPFDQPNVESAKVLARKMVAAYTETGKLPEKQPTVIDGAVKVYGAYAGVHAVSALHGLFDTIKPGDYISIHAYVNPTPEAEKLLVGLQNLLRDEYQLATTLGFGPRFLHSTGQLHKGDANNGLFILLTSDPMHDIAIPDEAGQRGSKMSFGVLKMAQALGDEQALLDNGRRVLRLHLGRNALGELDRIVGMLRRH